MLPLVSFFFHFFFSLRLNLLFFAKSESLFVSFSFSRLFSLVQTGPKNKKKVRQIPLVNEVHTTILERAIVRLRVTPWYYSSN